VQKHVLIKEDRNAGESHKKRCINAAISRPNH